MSGFFSTSRGSTSPSPLKGEGRGGGENLRTLRMWQPPTLTLPRKGGGDLLSV